MIKKLFFYSSRRMSRLRKSYTAVFVTSAVLLTLVTVFLCLAESYYLRRISSSKCGTYHASFRALTSDCTEKALESEHVSEAWSIPYTSLLASSTDASVSGYVTVETDEIDDILGVEYIWGHAPENGEIAVSEDIYRECAFLLAGEQNELYFKATEMCYEPLKVCGIYSCNDKSADYAFVSADTLAVIDRQTGARTKYDLYIKCRSSSDRYVAIAAAELFDSLRLEDNERQRRHNTVEGYSLSGESALRYAEYINTEYLDEYRDKTAAPLVLYILPVIVIAALMLASFMVNRVSQNSAEYGIMASLGAGHAVLCAVPAGQILIIAALSAVPVVLISALISNIYITAFNNSASLDADFVYSVPWGHLIETALWFVVLSGLFTYIGIARMTKEPPFVLISGPYRGDMPFVSRSASSLNNRRDKVLYTALLQSIRRIKASAVPAIITSLICIVCGTFVYFLSSGLISDLLFGRIGYSGADTIITAELPGTGSAQISEYDISALCEIPYVEDICAYAAVGDHHVWSIFYDDTDYTVSREAYMHITNDNGTQQWKDFSGYTSDRNALPHLYTEIAEGNPDSLFEGDSTVILAVSADEAKLLNVHAGDTVTFTGEVKLNEYRAVISAGETREYTVGAIVISGNSGYEALGSRCAIFTSAGAASLGLCGEGDYNRLLVYYSADISEDSLTEAADALAASPRFMRYNIINTRQLSSSDRHKSQATATLLVLFIIMVYVSYLTMTYTDSLLRVNGEKKELSVIRQLGADDSEIYKTTRAGTYPSSVLSLICTVLLYAVVVTVWTVSRTSRLSIQADMYPLTYTPQYLAECRNTIFGVAGAITSAFVLAIPFHILSALCSALGTVPPTKKILGESVTEGIRKDTD